MLEEAEIFVSVIENRSFSKAAKKLKLSASVVTRHIATLEKNLKVRLLQRTTRQVSLTEAGSIFYESCKTLLQTYQISLNQVKSYSDEIVGTIKIGLPNSISYLYVTLCVNQFIKKYPNIHIDIVIGNHLLDLLSNGFDFVIHCGELSDSSLYCRKLGEWTKITCAAPSYLAKVGVPKHPNDLLKYNCLDHYDNKDHQWKYIINNQIESLPIKGNIRSNSSMDLKNMACTGLGIVYLPSFIVKKEVQDGMLVELLKSYQVPPLNMYAVYPSNRFLSKKTQVFLDFIATLNMVF